MAWCIFAAISIILCILQNSNYRHNIRIFVLNKVTSAKLVICRLQLQMILCCTSLSLKRQKKIPVLGVRPTLLKFNCDNACVQISFSKTLQRFLSYSTQYPQCNVHDVKLLRHAKGWLFLITAPKYLAKKWASIYIQLAHCSSLFSQGSYEIQKVGS